MQRVDDGCILAGSTQEEFTVDYRLYQSFWRLQKYAMAQDTVIRGKDAESTWKALLNDVDQASTTTKFRCIRAALLLPGILWLRLYLLFAPRLARSVDGPRYLLV